MADHNGDNNKRLLRALLYLVTTIGFIYQSFHICAEHFNYPTITHLVIADTLERTTPPKLVLSLPYHVKGGNIGKSTVKVVF